jgi:hypothetical protein
MINLSLSLFLLCTVSSIKNLHFLLLDIFSVSLVMSTYFHFSLHASPICLFPLYFHCYCFHYPFSFLFVLYLLPAGSLNCYVTSFFHVKQIGSVFFYKMLMISGITVASLLTMTFPVYCSYVTHRGWTDDFVIQHSLLIYSQISWLS